MIRIEWSFSCYNICVDEAFPFGKLNICNLFLAFYLFPRRLHALSRISKDEKEQIIAPTFFLRFISRIYKRLSFSNNRFSRSSELFSKQQLVWSKIKRLITWISGVVRRVYPHLFSVFYSV